MDERFTSQQQMLEHALEQQVVLARIALELNSLEKFDFRINKCLKEIGQHTDVSRVYIFENNEEGTTVSNTFEWCNKGVSPEIKNLQNISYEDIPSWINSLKNEGRIYSENISELAKEVRDILEPQGVVSIIVYPLFIKGAFYGFMGFDECNKVRRWSASELEMLRAVSGIFSHAYERRAMEQELIRERDRANRANQAKSEFLANMGHEIRTPMNAILGFSEALYHRLSAPENRQMLSSVMSAGHRLLAMLNDLLDLSRIEAGRLELLSGPASPSTILYDIHSIYRDKATKKGLNLLVEIPKDLPATLVLDEARIRQVIGNLLANAIKFTQEGQVKLWGSFEQKKPDAGELVFGVEDTGIGIEKKMVDAIFEDFLQLNPQTNRKYEGTGLGLAISKRLVEKMNGRIEVESTPGQGSTFRIILPEIPVPAREQPQQYPPGQPQQHVTKDTPIAFEKARVLVVDDDRNNIEMIGALMETLGLESVGAENGSLALELLETDQPDIILLDNRMPGLDGLEVLKRIKADDRLRDIPVLAHTAYRPNAMDDPAVKLYDGFLIKPVSLKAVTEELAKHLKHSVSGQEGVSGTEEPGSQGTAESSRQGTEEQGWQGMGAPGRLGTEEQGWQGMGAPGRLGTEEQGWQGMGAPGRLGTEEQGWQGTDKPGWTHTGESLPLDPATMPEDLRGELPEIIKELRETYLPQWEQIKDHLVIFRIEAFASQLKALAEERNLLFLQAYAEKLMQETERFDIEALKESLAAFPDTLNKIERL
jgi:signal transduction histidine kinase/CheY-like chemotaxis protein